MDIPDAVQDDAEELEKNLDVSKFAPYGGYEAIQAFSIYSAAKRNGIPVIEDDIIDFFDNANFSTSFFKKMERELVKDVKTFDAGDYIEYYFERIDDTTQSGISERFSVSPVSVWRNYEKIVKNLADTDPDLNDPALTPASFGYLGDDEKEFALYLAEEQDINAGKRVLAASCIYIAANII